MPSVITAYFGQTRFLSILQHRPEVPTRVDFFTLRCYRFAPVHMYNKLAECGAGFAPAGMARMPWLGIRARHMRKLLTGGTGTTFLAFAFKKATKTLLINISNANLCNYCAQKHDTYEGFWHCPS